MPTLEERIAALERAQSILQSEQMDTKQIEERISALEQQVAEQRRRLSEHDQRFESLEKALAHQFHAINRRFDEQTDAIREQFGDTNMNITSLTVTVQGQGRDIKEMKSDIREMKGRLDGIDNRLDGIDQRFETTHQQIAEVRQDMNGRFGSLDEKLTQILERLPRQGES